MGLFDRFRRRSTPMSALVGCWQQVQPRSDREQSAEAEFADDGQLVYSVLAGDSWQIMKLVYEVDGDVIVTDQVSAPRKERTRFALQPDGTLMLELAGERSFYKRGPKLAPKV